MTLSHSQALNRLEPILKRFGYQKPPFFQALEDRFFYKYSLTKGHHTLSIFLEYWRVQDRLTPFLTFSINVPHPERFIIYTAELQDAADSLLYDTDWQREKLDDLLHLGLKVVCETQQVTSLQRRLQSPVLQATLNSLLAARDSFYLFSDLTYELRYGVALSEPLERRATLWLNAAEQFASVFDDPSSRPIAQRAQGEHKSMRLLSMLLFIGLMGLLCVSLYVLPLLLMP